MRDGKFKADLTALRDIPGCRNRMKKYCAVRSVFLFFASGVAVRPAFRKSASPWLVDFQLFACVAPKIFFGLPLGYISDAY
jgi:hypothetical protein